MTPPTWGIVAVLVVGTAAVVFGWWWDRRQAHRAAAAVRAAPDRALPGLGADVTPAYVTPDDLAGLGAPDATLPTDLADQLDAAPTLAAGVPDAAFLSPGDAGGSAPTARAVALDPLVAVLDAAVRADRGLLPLLAHAGRRGRALVVVAASFDEEALATLAANHLTGRLRIVPVSATPEQRRHAASVTGAQLLSADDLASGWLPAEAWGRCRAWVASTEGSWVVP